MPTDSLTETVDLPDEAATVALGRKIAARLRPGDTMALKGELGAGKSTLARALIRQLAGDPDLEVPSPTFTLVQAYQTRIGEVWHVDLYRLGSPDELDELGVEDAIGRAIVLIEWPERMAGRLPPRRVEVALGFKGEGRTARIIWPAADAP